VVSNLLSWSPKPETPHSRSGPWLGKDDLWQLFTQYGSKPKSFKDRCTAEKNISATWKVLHKWLSEHKKFCYYLMVTFPEARERRIDYYVSPDQKPTLLGIIMRVSPLCTLPDSILPITTVPISLNLSINGILQTCHRCTYLSCSWELEKV